MSATRVQLLLLRVWGTMAFPTTRDDDGATLIEYVLLVALIAVVCITAVAFFGTQTAAKYSSVGSKLS